MDILIPENFENFKEKSFFIFRPYSNKYQIGLEYNFLKYNRDWISKRILKEILIFNLSDIPNHFTWLINNTEKELFLEIQVKIYNAKLTDKFCLLFFSDKKSYEYYLNQTNLNL